MGTSKLGCIYIFAVLNATRTVEELVAKHRNARMPDGIDAFVLMRFRVLIKHLLHRIHGEMVLLSPFVMSKVKILTSAMIFLK